jgi:aspartyl-tRNA synthetase
MEFGELNEVAQKTRNFCFQCSWISGSIAVPGAGNYTRKEIDALEGKTSSRCFRNGICKM